jgi:hypothetical protein
MSIRPPDTGLLDKIGRISNRRINMAGARISSTMGLTARRALGKFRLSLLMMGNWIVAKVAQSCESSHGWVLFLRHALVSSDDRTPGYRSVLTRFLR